ncbi:MAG: hypothetical protein LBC43_03970 [Bifidobacteriaceae bacterium]|jgi:hypothetical protein|nr:hypothetical protein [Bifidobacteriaceae bacterium]
MNNPNSPKTPNKSLPQAEQADTENLVDVFRIDGFYNPDTQSWEWFDE